MCLPFSIFAQQITGVWTGTMNTTGSSLPYELVIVEDKGKLSGYSMTIFVIDGFDNMGVKSIKLKNKNGAVLLEDDDLIYDNYTTPPKRSKLTSNLSLSVYKGEMILSGTFTTRSLDFRDNSSYNGIIRLQKSKPGALTKLVARLELINLSNPQSVVQQQPKKKERPPAIANPDLQKEKAKQTISESTSNNKEVIIASPGATAAKKELSPELKEQKKELTIVSKTNTEIKPVGKPAQKQPVIAGNSITRAQASLIPENAAAKLASRKIETIRSVQFASDSLVISLFDNGEVDGDTVSVILNNKIIISKRELTANAITTTIYITPDLGDSLQLVLFAENLGSIPPNTGLLTVRDGNNRYEIRFTGDLQKNSAIILRKKK